MLVRLTLKLADTMDGIDVSHVRQGDLIDLSASDAELLIAEGWAEGVAGNGDRDTATNRDCVTTAKRQWRSQSGSD